VEAGLARGGLAVVEAVVEQFADPGRLPVAAVRALDPAPVEIVGDGAQALPVGVALEDVARDQGLGGMWLEALTRRLLVAERALTADVLAAIDLRGRGALGAVPDRLAL
jgi:hypothetical protein